MRVRTQYRLRSLLAAIAGVAVVLGLGVRWSRMSGLAHRHQQQEQIFSTLALLVSHCGYGDGTHDLLTVVKTPGGGGGIGGGLDRSRTAPGEAGAAEFGSKEGIREARRPPRSASPSLPARRLTPLAHGTGRATPAAPGMIGKREVLSVPPGADEPTGGFSAVPAGGQEAIGPEVKTAGSEDPRRSSSRDRTRSLNLISLPCECLSFRV